MNKRTPLSLLTVLSASIALQLSAAVILYDDFNSGNYTGNVNNDTGDADVGGYDGNWAGDTLPGGVAQWNSTGLTYSGMTTTAGSLEVNRPSGSFAGGFYTATIDPLGAASGNVIYFSALINIDAGVNGARFGLDMAQDGNSRRSELGFTSAGNAAIWNDAGFDDPAASPVATSSGTYAFATTYLLVGKIEDAANWAGANDRVTMWLNPTDNVEANNTPLLSSEVGFNGLFPSQPGITEFAFQAGTNDEGESAYLDELRIGDSFSDVVTVIPEPSAFALFGLAGIAAVLGMRRRKA